MSVKYDQGLIEEQAGRLYAKAASVQISSTVMGLLGGIVVGFLGGTAYMAACQYGGYQGRADVVVSLIVAALVMGGFAGRSRGRRLAFAFRLEAQLALCQVQIEKNTRQASP